MLDIKKLFTKILNLGVFKDSNGDISITHDITAGNDITANGTVTGDVFHSDKGDGVAFEHVSDGSGGNQDTGIKARRTDQDTQVFFGVGGGGVTHGIYSNKNSRWMIYDDATGITKLPASSATVHGNTIATKETIVTTNHDTVSITINGSSTSAQNTQTYTKAGYYPLGIVGYQLLGSQAVWLRLLELQMSARSNGSVTVRYRIRNQASANSTGTYIHFWILWIKV